LIWGRAAALLGRSGLALFDLEDLLLEIYVDDPHSVIQGCVRLGRGVWRFCCCGGRHWG
jgi:hypothetical protein